MTASTLEAKLPEQPAGAPTPVDLPETLIKPASPWQLLDLGELWRYRDLLLMLTWRDISVRYKQTVLGVAWAVLQPTMMMIVFAVVFGRLAGLSSGDLPYPIFVFAGLLPWTFFSSAVSNAAHSVVENERLVTKVYFPRLAIPLAAIGAALVDFTIASCMLIVLMLVYGVTPGWSLLAVPVAVGLLLLTAIGVGSMLSALNVAYRDFRYVVAFLMQLWMFATPSIYMEQAAAAGSAFRPHTAPQIDKGEPINRAVSPIPSGNAVKSILRWNPMTPLITFFRAAVLGQPIPWQSLFTPSLTIAAVLLMGLTYFRRVESNFADII